jgi:drug/metabolite transporter (DMT)-like permease
MQPRYVGLAASDYDADHGAPPPAPPSITAAVWASGTACIATAALAYSVAAALVRPLNPDIPVFQIVAVRSALSLAFSVAAGRSPRAGPDAPPRHPLFGRRANMPFLALRGFVGALAMDCFYSGIIRLPLADAVSLLFVNPAITAVLAWAVLGERLGPGGVAGCALSLAGMVAVVQPPFLFGGGDAWSRRRAVGTAFAASSAVLAAGAYLAIRLIGK